MLILKPFMLEGKLSKQLKGQKANYAFPLRNNPRSLLNQSLSSQS